MSHQRGSLRKEGSQWVLRFQQGAVRRAVRLGSVSEFRTRAAARAQADNLMQLQGVAVPAGRRITFSDYVPAFMSRHATGIVRRSTELQWRGTLSRHLVPHFGLCLLEVIDTEAVQAYIAKAGDSGLSRTRVRNIVQLLRQVLRTAGKEGYAAHPLPPFTLRFPKDTVARPPRRCLAPADAQRIIEAAVFPEKALYAIMAHTGCRCGEALGLEWRHIDFSKKVIRIRQAAVMGRIYLPKTQGSIADLPMTQALSTILAVYLMQCQEPGMRDLLFANARGKPMSASGVRQNRFHPLLARLGLEPAGLHSFRHGLATSLFEAGAPPAVVQATLRHGNLRTTMSYTHTTSDGNARWLEKTSQGIAGAPP